MFAKFRSKDLWRGVIRSKASRVRDPSGCDGLHTSSYVLILRPGDKGEEERVAVNIEGKIYLNLVLCYNHIRYYDISLLS